MKNIPPREFNSAGESENDWKNIQGQVGLTKLSLSNEQKLLVDLAHRGPLQLEV